MRLLKFSKKLFNDLKEKGIRYCYSRTIIDDNQPGRVSIILTPCVKRPNIRRLPKSFDTFFSIKRELRQMAEGIDEDVQVFLSFGGLE